MSREEFEKELDAILNKWNVKIWVMNKSLNKAMEEFKNDLLQLYEKNKYNETD